MRLVVIYAAVVSSPRGSPYCDGFEKIDLYLFGILFLLLYLFGRDRAKDNYVTQRRVVNGPTIRIIKLISPHVKNL